VTEKTRNNNNKKSRIGWWIFLGVVVAVGAFFGWRFLKTRQETSQMITNIETEPYQRKTLSAYIYGTGTVQPIQTAILTWSANGIVGEVNAELGQFVEEDMLLMSLELDSLSVDILQAKIEVINAQNNLDNLHGRWESDLAQAKLDLSKAHENLEDLESERTIMNFQRCTDERIEELEDNLDLAERFYNAQQSSDNLLAVTVSKANLDYCRADYTEREVAEAELQVTLGETRVADLQEMVDLLSDGPDPDQVTILETQLAIAQTRLDSPMIEAPFDGVVTVVSAQEGDLVQVGTQAIRLDDLSDLNLDVLISEIDIPFVKVGQSAGLVFDAYYEDTFNGEVTEIALVGQNVQGIVEYTVRINLKDADDRIKPGMTAAVNIVVDEKEDILVVPNDAIVSIDGQEYVFVLRNGDFEDVPVIFGSYSDYYSEVLEADIDEGELIALNPPEEITGESSFGGGPMGGSFPGMGR